MIIEELIALLGFDLEGEGDLKRFADGLQGAEKNAQRAAKSIGVLGVAVGSFIGTMAAQAAFRLGDIIGSLPGDILATGSEFEALGIRLETLEGSSEKAQAALDWIRKFAASTPLDLAQAADAYANLKNYGLDPTAGALQAMVDAMSASGKGVGQLDRLVLALGQAWTKTKLQGGEILQLTEAGIPVWQMLAEATGKSIPELQKLSEAGKLGRKEIQLLIEAIGKKYAGASQKFAKSMTGVTDKITEQWTEFKKRVADAGFFNWFKDRANDLLDVLERWERDGTLDAWARRTSKAFTATGDALLRFWRLVLRLGSWIGKAFDSLGQAIADGLRWISGGAIDLSNMEALAAAGALLFGAISPLAAAFVAGGLAVDDFLAYLEGGDSVIGKWIDQLPNFVAAFDKVAPGVRSAVQSTIALLKEGDWTGAGIMAAEAYARGWNVLSGLLQPYVDQAKAYLTSVDWVGAINAGITNSSVALNSIDWGDVGAEGGRLGAILAAALVASLAKELHGASVAIGNAVKGSIEGINWWEGGVTGLIVDSLTAQFHLITGVLVGITGEIRAAVLEWFNIDLNGAGLRLAQSLWAGFKSYLPDWKSLLWGDAADPNFDPREHFRIENAINQDRPREIRLPQRDRPVLEDRATRERAGVSTSQRTLDGMDQALQQIRAGLSAVSGDNAGQKVQETIANDNRVLNQSNTVNAPVTVNATLTNTTPGAVGAAAGAGVRSAGNAAVRSLAVTGSPSFGGPR